MSHMVAVLTTIAFAAEENAEFDATSVSPGVVGFIVTALLAVAVIFLGFDLVRRLRRSKYRHEIRESLAVEIAEREAQSRGGFSGSEGAEPDPRA